MLLTGRASVKKHINKFCSINVRYLGWGPMGGVGWEVGGRPPVQGEVCPRTVERSVAYKVVLLVVLHVVSSPGQLSLGPWLSYRLPPEQGVGLTHYSTGCALGRGPGLAKSCAK